MLAIFVLILLLLSNRYLIEQKSLGIRNFLQGMLAIQLVPNISLTKLYTNFPFISSDILMEHIVGQCN